MYEKSYDGRKWYPVSMLDLEQSLKDSIFIHGRPVPFKTILADLSQGKPVYTRGVQYRRTGEIKGELYITPIVHATAICGPCGKAEDKTATVTVRGKPIECMICREKYCHAEKSRGLKTVGELENDIVFLRHLKK